MNTPDIRFKGFSDAWKQSKLKDVADKVTEKNSALSVQETFTNSAEFGVISQRDFFDRDISNADNIGGYYVIHEEDFVYNPRISATAPVGPINRNKLGRNGVMSPLYTIFRTHGVDSTYLEWFFKSKNWHPFMYFNGDSGARSDRFSIKDTVFFGMPIPLPSQDEQKRIGDILEHLDVVITLHQHKLDTLKNYKKAMLVKMFPREGQKVPEIRFKGFTGDWEPRKLSDIYQSIGNAFVGTATPYYVKSGHFYLESNNVKNGQINHNTEVFINDQFYKRQKEKWLHTGDMVMVQSGHVGHSAVIPEELNNTAAHALIMFKNPKMRIEPYFLNYQYQTAKSRKKIDSITTGNTVEHILASSMQDFVVDVTSLEEQTKIAVFFQNLDNVITLNQHMLDKLKDLKQAMLNKMFVKGGN